MIAVADLAARLDRLEAERDVRALMAEYVALCDRLGRGSTAGDIADLFTADAEWIGVGPDYVQEYGRHRGRDAITAFFDEFCRHEPHFRFNAHFLTSERIEPGPARARGRWLMLQAATRAVGSDLRGARLDVRFARDGAAWKIERFETARLLALSVDGWNHNERASA